MRVTETRIFAECNNLGLSGAQDIVFTPNATHALNVVINSIELCKNDKVYMLDIGMHASR